MIDESAMENDGAFVLLGYFSLALKVLHIPDGISIRRRARLDGLSGKIHGEIITDIPCYLIGQLARNDAASKSSCPGKLLIDQAQSIILSSMKAVGGRLMLIECRSEDALIRFYERNGFTAFNQDMNGNVSMTQMICVIEE